VVAAVKCPYGEQRGFAVYCRAAGKLVNPLVMPCRSPNYAKCRFYAQAEERKRREEAPPAQPAASAGGGGEPQARESPQQAPPETQPPEAPQPGGSQGLLDSWSMEESRRLADPINLARILVGASAVAAERLPAGGLSEFLEALGRLAGGTSGCLLAIASLPGGDVYMKVCGGRIVASASRSGPLEPGDLEKMLREAGGRVSVVLYSVEGL
jgi:hypothetical protein